MGLSKPYHERSPRSVLLQADAIPKNTVGAPSFRGIGARKQDLEPIPGPFRVGCGQVGDEQGRTPFRSKLVEEYSAGLPTLYCRNPGRRTYKQRGNENEVGVGRMHPDGELSARKQIGAAQVFYGESLGHFPVFANRG